MNRGQRRAQWLAQHRNRLMGIRAAQQTSETAAGQATTSALDRNVPEAHASSVRVHIEELVLHGFPAGSRYPIGDATQQELGRLLTERGVPQRMMQPGETARIDAGSFQVRQEARPSVVGAQVANAVYGVSKR